MLALRSREGLVKASIPRELYMAVVKLQAAENCDGSELCTCPLAEEESKLARSSLNITPEEVKGLIKYGKPFVLFSGGKDSLCALTYVKELADEVGEEVIAIHVDTTACLPDIPPYVEEVCKSLGVELKIVRPKVDFFTLAKRKGLPRIKSRWCCEKLKIKPIAKYLGGFIERKVVFDGIRGEESYARRKYLPIWYHPSFKCVSASPIFYWKESQVNEYVHERGLQLNPARIWFSAECWCGAYARKRDFELLKARYPDFFKKLLELEQS